MSVNFSDNLPPLRETRKVTNKLQSSFKASNGGIDENKAYSGMSAA